MFALQEKGAATIHRFSTLSARLHRVNARVDHILDEALELPPDERSALTVALLDSLEGSDDASITQAWRQEVRARQAALRAGEVKPVSWMEAKARLSAL
ncbi:MAG: addiction module protein [Burkholderiaceae bacterium]|jgi:putative addiction module component (TIGR02574 family)|nr:addiction module protein [Pseudomonadota bacterium]MBS0596490.1 addiction module protein [Pseudomonadota bacterium]MCP5219223.1 addiction module protein [Burkholderiaceae bacterium]